MIMVPAMAVGAEGHAFEDFADQLFPADGSGLRCEIHFLVILVRMVQIQTCRVGLPAYRAFHQRLDAPVKEMLAGFALCRSSIVRQPSLLSCEFDNSERLIKAFLQLLFLVFLRCLVAML